MADLFEDDVFEAKVRELAQGYGLKYGDLPGYSVEDEIAKMKVGSLLRIHTFQPSLPVPNLGCRVTVTDSGRTALMTSSS